MIKQIFSPELSFRAITPLFAVFSVFSLVLSVIVFNELLLFHMDSNTLIVTCFGAAILGYLLYVITPVIVKLMPIFLILGFFAVMFFRTEIHELETNSFRQQWLQETNYCQGFALVNKSSSPNCIKPNSKTLGNCTFLSGNEYQCDSVFTNDVVYSFVNYVKYKQLSKN